MNDCINQIQQAIIKLLSTQTGAENFDVTSTFKPLKSAITKPIVSLDFKKTSISTSAFNNHIAENPCKPIHKISTELSFGIYVPKKMGSNYCYTIFENICNTLLTYSKDISFDNISCENIEFTKSLNCFFLNCFSTICVFAFEE